MSYGTQPPPIPQQDYTGAAEATAKGSVDAINAQTEANRPNQYTPWGSSTWEQGADGQWTQTVSLDPRAQAALDSQMGVQTGRSQLAQGMLGQAAAAYSSPMDWDALPAAPDAQGARDQAISAAYGQASSRLDPQWAQREEQTRARLYNMGFREGDQGYETQMANLGRDRNDAYTSAMNSAIGQGTAAQQSLFNMGQAQYQQALASALQKRNQPLNEVNALLSGQQVQSPNMPGFVGAGAAQGPNYLGAAGMQYQSGLDAFNAQQMQQQGMMSGIGGIAGMALPFMFSDERLKVNVHRLDSEALPGIPWAAWEWRGAPGSRAFGVIAQDVERVRPDLVARHSSGFLMVNYAGLVEGA